MVSTMLRESELLLPPRGASSELVRACTVCTIWRIFSGDSA